MSTRNRNVVSVPDAETVGAAERPRSWTSRWPRASPRRPSRGCLTALPGWQTTPGHVSMRLSTCWASRSTKRRGACAPAGPTSSACWCPSSAYSVGSWKSLTGTSRKWTRCFCTASRRRHPERDIDAVEMLVGRGVDALVLGALPRFERRPGPRARAGAGTHHPARPRGARLGCRLHPGRPRTGYRGCHEPPGRRRASQGRSAQPGRQDAARGARSGPDTRSTQRDSTSTVTRVLSEGSTISTVGPPATAWMPSWPQVSTPSSRPAPWSTQPRSWSGCPSWGYRCPVTWLWWFTATRAPR